MVVDSVSFSKDSIQFLVAEPLSLEDQIDQIVSESIQSEAFPGCVIYACTGDSILFQKAYGHHTYDSIQQVETDAIYDLASVTKVTGATLAIMKLYDNGLIHLDDPISKYVDGLGRKVGNVSFRESLAHQAGLYPWIPFYLESRKKNGDYKSRTVGSKKEGYSYQLNDSLYLYDNFYDRIKKLIRKSEVSSKKEYRYSGLFFYLVPELVELLTDTSYQDYLDYHFFQPLDAKTLTFNPLEKFDADKIVPTEIDTYFRMQQIHGTVHDEGAITMRGISGNAGLFSNAEDLAKVWKMFLNEGITDTIQYLRKETLQLFTTTQYPNNKNRRGLGFDKPLLTYDSLASSVAKSASYRSYGHSGFTGTLVWADPSNDLLFIFLTNRVYPSRENRAIYKLNVRPRIHQLVYDMIINGSNK